MHEVLVNRLGGLSLPRKSVVRLTDCPDMTLDVYRGRKTTIQQYNSQLTLLHSERPKLHRVLAFLSAIGLIKGCKSVYSRRCCGKVNNKQTEPCQIVFYWFKSIFFYDSHKDIP